MPPGRGRRGAVRAPGAPCARRRPRASRPARARNNSVTRRTINATVSASGLTSHSKQPNIVSIVTSRNKPLLSSKGEGNLAGSCVNSWPTKPRSLPNFSCIFVTLTLTSAKHYHLSVSPTSVIIADWPTRPKSVGHDGGIGLSRGPQQSQYRTSYKVPYGSDTGHTTVLCPVSACLPKGNSV